MTTNIDQANNIVRPDMVDHTVGPLPWNMCHAERSRFEFISELKCVYICVNKFHLELYLPLFCCVYYSYEQVHNHWRCADMTNRLVAYIKEVKI